MDSEQALNLEFQALSRRGLIAPLGGNGSARLAVLGIQAAACTRYGGFFLGPQSTENFLLATDDQERVVAAVCQGNQKHTNTMVAGALALSELYEHVCGNKRTDQLRADLARAMSSANDRILEIGRSSFRLEAWSFASCFVSALNDLKNIGSSVTAVALSKSGMVVAHVGECMVFRYRQGRLERVSDDHTLRAQPDFEEALQSSPELGEGPSRVLGMSDQTTVDFATRDLAPDDIIVVSSSLAFRLELEKMLQFAGRDDSKRICDFLTDATPLEERPDLAATFVVLKVLDLP